MSNKMKAMVTIAILAVVIVTAASLKIYFVSDGGGGDALWNANEAYLFVYNVRRGYHWSYLEYPLVVLGEYFYAVPLPDNQRAYLTVFKVTPTGSEHRAIDEETDTANSPDFYTPVGADIYAWCPGVVCKWTGTNFEPVGNAEEQRIGGLSGLSSKEFTGVNGWSKRGFGPAPVEYKFTIKPDGKFELSVVNHSADRSGYGAVSVDLLRPGRAPERIWYLDGHPRRVSKAEYEHVLGRR